MSPGTTLRLALAGTRTDTLRVALTAISAALASVAVLSAATVLAIRTPDSGDDPSLSVQYQSDLLQQPGLRPGVAMALLLLCVPVLALAVQCSRLGAPARDRRLAALRLAGATPGQTLAVITAEAGLATLIGVLAGAGIFLGGHRLLDRRNARGELWLPTDVLPPSWAIVAICVTLPVAAMLVGALLLRRVRVTPFGVTRQAERNRTPHTWPGLVLVAGFALLLGFAPLAEWLGERAGTASEWLVYLVFFAVPLAMAVGVIAGTGAIAYLMGVALRRWGRAPSMLLAGARLMADPWSGSRVLAALLACVLVGGVSAGYRAQFQAMSDAEWAADRLWTEATGEPTLSGPHRDGFYLNAMNLVDLAVAVAVAITALALLIAAVDGLVSRRRAYASLVATGVPRGVIARSVVWQVLTPAVPAVLIAAVSGWMITRVLGREVTAAGVQGTICTVDGPICGDPVAGAQYLREVNIGPIVQAVPVPVQGLLLLIGGALLAVLVTAGISLLLLRGSTAVEELRTA
ncbi:hypothetical protein J2S43_007326 [Catenuloplanes nepalensis]|uniref:ABC3 transporter permease C-terminal domain-containing protein n=1 Tax=Catenuloplanes nepalensis TaxID=587533 RepID=A0ABT9N549_9ACTN|nr:FtsX-like permease family protein [Catenuloplanes nepalensis]MDP9798814.1 hypothetical protein [Catenuloplanes nepalensis]